MSGIAKVIEVMAEGNTVEGAMEAAVAGASGSVRNITGVYLQDVKGIIENGEIVRYRANCKITFVVDG